MSRWFRFYDDALNDPKVQRLPADLFKAWVNLLCLASKNGGEIPSLADAGFALRLSESKAGAIVADLALRGLFDPVEGGYFSPHNWGCRQYKSDVSNERVKRYRERKCNVTSDVTVTPPDTEQIQSTETDKKEEPSLRSGVSALVNVSHEKQGDDWPKDYRDLFWNGYPRKKAKKAALKALDRVRRSGEVTFERLIASVRKIPRSEPAFIPHPATWLNAGRWDDEELPGEQNGQGRPRAFQNDELSVSKAAERLGDRIKREGIVAFAPRPTLLPREGEDDLLLLPPGRSSRS